MRENCRVGCVAEGEKFIFSGKSCLREGAGENVAAVRGPYRMFQLRGTGFFGSYAL